VSVIVCQTPPELLAVSSREVALALDCFCYTLIVLSVNFGDDVTCHLFAYDVKLYTVINTLTDCRSLQKGLDKVYDWSVAHQLPISVRKRSCIVLGKIDILNVVYNIGK